MPETLHSIGPVDRLAASPLFAGIETEGVARVLETARRLYFKAGEVILHAGDTRTMMYIVEAGLVFLAPGSDVRDPHRPKLVETGHVLNQRAYITSDPAPQRAVAAMASVVVVLDRKKIAHVEPGRVGRAVMLNAVRMISPAAAKVAA